MTKLTGKEIIIAFFFNFSIGFFASIMIINQFEQTLRVWYIIIATASLLMIGPSVMTIWVMVQIKK